MLVAAGAEVVMREDRADGAVFAVVVDERVGPPALDQGLRADESAVRPRAKGRVGGGREYLRPADGLLISVVGGDAAADFFRRERAALIVPAIARAVRR